jgi:hypothetical protein
MIILLFLWFLAGLPGAWFFMVAEFRHHGEISRGEFFCWMLFAAGAGPLLMLAGLLFYLGECTNVAERIHRWCSRPIVKDRSREDG